MSTAKKIWYRQCRYSRKDLGVKPGEPALGLKLPER